ncbi:hypothetical protein GCM10020000_55920 [Streptomyces olivoverticillatus]
MRLDARLGQVGDADVIAADLLRQVLHGVERRDDLELSVLGAGARAVASPAGGQRQKAGGRGECDGGGAYSARGEGPEGAYRAYVHDTHFQQKNGNGCQQEIVRGGRVKPRPEPIWLEGWRRR